MTMLVFIKKEIMEILKTSKIIIMPAVFLFFGIISPLSARFTKELIGLMGDQQGVTIRVPDPVYTDSYLQLFKNLNFVAIIVLILIFAGSVADEKVKGTAAMVLTKNLSRVSFITGKMIAAVLFLTTTYAISAAICIFYTSLLFPVYYNDKLITGLLIHLMYMVMIITISYFASVISKSYMSAAVLAFVVCITISLVGSIPDVSAYTPGVLQSLTTEIITGTKNISDVYIPLLETVVISVGCIIGSITIFNKQEI